MKNWEVIKALYENPRLQFKNKRFGGVLGYDENGHLAWLSGVPKVGEIFTIHYNPGHPFATGNYDDDWELVPQPVPFLEAVKAYSEGKTVECKSKGFGTRVYEPGVNHPYAMIDQSDTAVTAHEILHGEWLIK